jgi:hypothetical protein
MSESQEQLPSTINVIIISSIIFFLALAVIIFQHNMTFQKEGTIVLPAGGTYLGPNGQPTDTPALAQATPIPTAMRASPAEVPTNVGTKEGKFTVPADAAWVIVRGNAHPYAFLAPKTLKLVTFPNDKYDIYAIEWNNLTPQSNVLIGVDDMNFSNNLKKYINVSKKTYVEDWWKQFGGLKGVFSIAEFTNSKNLKGYKAKYLNQSNQSPIDDIFFEIPNHPEFVMHLSNGVLDQAIFDRIVDSVSWNE